MFDDDKFSVWAADAGDAIETFTFEADTAA